MAANASARADKSAAPKFWVGIGSSAGGLEALRGLVQNLPDKLDAAFVVVQHTAPHFRSMLAAIISRETRLTVLDVKDGVKPKANHIYITPPNCNIEARDGCLAGGNRRRS